MDNILVSAGNTIRVLIVDDHAVVRQGLHTFLELQDHSELPIEVVGEASNGKVAVELAQQTQPDVILLDLVMPEMDGIRAIPKIMECSPMSRIIVLTSFDEEDKVLPAIRAGAHGYLLKDIPPDELVHAVREAYLGKVQLHPEVAKKLMSALAEETITGRQGGNDAKSDLTDREREVLSLIAHGLSNRDVEGKIFVSEKTVKTHVSSILSKLHLADRTQAAIYFEVSILRLMKINNNRHDLTDAQLSGSLTFSTSVFQQFSLPDWQKALAKIIYTHKQFE